MWRAFGVCVGLLAACATPVRDRTEPLPAARDLAMAAVAGDMMSVAPSDLAGGDLSCARESDGEFCARLGKSCEAFSGTDSCGQPRNANCGACSGATPACVGNVCRAPLCGTSYVSPGSDVNSVDISLRQDALLGIASNGNSILYLQATADCVGNGAKLLIGDDPSGGLAFVSQDVSALANLANFVKSEESMTLSGDGLTLVGITTTHIFAAATRSAAGKIDFAAPSRSIFDTVNGALPAAGTLSWPVLSADLLAFYYRVDNATNANADGIYEALRASTSVPFAAGQKMPAALQAYLAISGMSADRLTAFMATTGYGTAILTRSSWSQPFAAPVPAAVTPVSGWRIMPFAGCTKLAGTYEPGGCTHESIRVWSAM